MKADDKGRPAIPRAFTRGQELRASDLEAMRETIAFIMENLVKGGPGILTTKIGNSFVVSLERKARGGGAPRENFPFQVLIAPSEENDPAKVKIRFGTVNNIIPEIGENPLEPNIEDSPELELINNETNYIYIVTNLVESTRLIDKVEIERFNEFKLDTFLVSYQLINTVEVEDQTVKSIGTAQIRTSLNYAFTGAIGQPHLYWKK